jgi:hypothetical protein
MRYRGPEDDRDLPPDSVRDHGLDNPAAVDAAAAVLPRGDHTPH